MNARTTLSEAQSPSPEHQLALQLFSDLRPSTKSIAESPTDVGFNINQVLVDVKDLTLVGRKALIAAYFLAATSPRNASGKYVFDLDFFKWLIKYKTSNNLDHLKKGLEEAQKSGIEMNIIDPEKPSRDKWARVPLMGTVTIQGGKIGFQLPADLVSELVNPGGIAMYLSLRIQANFTSIYAQTLFAKIAVKPLIDAGASPWMTLPEFAKWMNVDQYEWAKEYRYLNRDVIQVAMKQVNTHSDLELTLETKNVRGTRRVEFIRFTIEMKSEWVNAASEVTLEREIFEVLKNEIRLSAKDRDLVLSNRTEWTNEQLLEAIEYTRRRINHPAKEKLEFPGSYFLKALRDGYQMPAPAKKQAAKATLELEREQRAKIQADGKTLNKTLASEAKKIMAAFDGLNEDVKVELWAKYRNSPAKVNIKQVEKKENGGQEMTRDALLAFSAVHGGFVMIVKKYLGL